MQQKIQVPREKWSTKFPPSASDVAALERKLGTPQSKWVADFGSRSALTALGNLKQSISLGVSNVDVFVIGDSTGVGDTRWVRLWATELAALYPTHSVNYYAWDSTDYAAVVNVSSGTGAKAINIYNASLSGSKPSRLMGSNFAAAFSSKSSAPACVIWNHGHNLLSMSTPLLRGAIVGPMEQIRLQWPTTPQAVIVQNPNSGDTTYAPIATELRRVIADRTDTQAIDVYQVFADAGKPAAWYVDSIHPSSLGSAKYVDTVMGGMDASASQLFTGDPAWLATSGENLLLNGDFSAFGSAVPDSWNLSGDGTLTKETTTVVPGRPHSVKIVNGAAATYLWQTLAGTAYRGQYLTLLALIRDDAGGNLNTGRLRSYADGSTVNYLLNQGDTGTGGFRWKVIAGLFVESDTTTLGAYIYSNASGGTSSTIYIDRVVLVAGDKPRNI